MKETDMQPEVTGFSLVYVTCPDMRVAERLARLAIGKKLAACANLIADMKAIYPWQGKIKTAGEVVLLLKTRKSLVPDLIRQVEKKHPYDVPAILEIPLGQVSEGFADWLLAETREA